MSELLSHTPGTPGVTGACRSGRFMCFGLWAYTREVLTCQLLSLEGSTGSIYTGLQWLVKFLLHSTTFPRESQRGLPPANESLQSWHCPLATTLGPPETAMPIAENTTAQGLPAINTANRPAVCCSSPSSPRSRPNQDQQPTVVAQPFTPGAKATQNNLLDAVGSDSESS